jgi:hypothetical protein
MEGERMSGAAGALVFYCQDHACHLDQIGPWVTLIFLFIILVALLYRKFKKKKVKK